MMETCTQEGHPGWESGKASWRKGQLTQELAKCTDKEECFKWKEEPSKGPETRKGMVQLRNQKRFGVARKLSLGFGKQ